MKGKLQSRNDSRVHSAAADAEQIAITLLGRIAAEPERLGTFLSVTGLKPEELRAAAGTAGFLPSVLDYVMDDEALLLALTGEAGIAPEAVSRARARLAPVSPEFE